MGGGFVGSRRWIFATGGSPEVDRVVVVVPGGGSEAGDRRWSRGKFNDLLLLPLSLSLSVLERPSGTTPQCDSLLKGVSLSKLPKWGAFPKNGLVASSSPWFDMYGNDFGWGKPVAVRSGSSNKIN
ncbi:hypothetical protein RHMOL_Rhmol09G0164400 [Rhododendron molle]|uniref:Uncharacterized protein n=1 Tax=Rhododendron molle TaxID=49168 RepID=A0ACC0MFY0_RHOML|nr:hypothetical protein RHMOL_Rhmol09G0164400 [Rhododendron molle]